MGAGHQLVNMKQSSLSDTRAGSFRDNKNFALQSMEAKKSLDAVPVVFVRFTLCRKVNRGSGESQAECDM
jgi:hypothetical protein